MLEGAPLNPVHTLDGPTFGLVMFSLLGVWVLFAGFPREVHRLGWAWSRPRNLALRNASETPRTMGVALNVLVSLAGLTAGVLLVEQKVGLSISWWGVPVWVLAGLVVRMIGGLVAFGPGDLSSALMELSRHNNTWVGMSLAVWAGLVMFNPHLQALHLEVVGLVVIFSCAMVHGALRATQLVKASNSQGVVGILYLCTLEWGWTLLWIFWSLSQFLRGH